VVTHTQPFYGSLEDEVLSLVQEQRSLVHVIKQRQANWKGHVLRHHRLLKTVLEGKKEDVGPTHVPRGQEDQLPRVEERS